MTPHDFTPVAWPHEDGSTRTVSAHRRRTFVKKLGACQVLIVKERPDQPLKESRYWATSALTADLTTVVGWVAQQWAIEQYIADVKEEFGTDHYQIRSTTGIFRFWHLAFLAYLYLEEKRSALRAPGPEPGLTIGQMCAVQQKRRRRRLLGWMGNCYADGRTSEQIDHLLAA